MRFFLILLLLIGAPVFAEIQSITQTADETIWVGTSSALYKLNRDIPQKVESSSIHSLAVNQNAVWAASSNGLLLCQNSSCQKVGSPPSGEIIFLAANDRTLWTASETELYRFDGKMLSSAGVPGNIIQAIASDKTGAVWIGTRRNISRFKEESFQQMFHNSAQALTSDSQGDIWIGSGYEITHWSNGKTTLLQLPPPAANVRTLPPIKTLLVSRDGTLWVGTLSGLLKFNGKDFQKIVPEIEVTSLFEAKDSALWIGSTDGLKKIVKGKLSKVSLPTEPEN